MNVHGFWISRFKAGTFVWIPATVVARIVIEELRQAIQKRTQAVHVLGFPRLLWSDWRRHIYKSADLIIETPVVCGDILPIEMHETLMLVIYFPYLNRCP